MKRLLLSFVSLCVLLSLSAQDFARYFADKTLRVDYQFTGDAMKQAIFLDGMSTFPVWAGRRHNLDQLPLEGNGQLVMRDAATGTVIYRHSFSALFYEWLSTDEAKQVAKAYEHTCLLPYPLQPVEIEVSLNSARRERACVLKHRIDPKDVLIRQYDGKELTPHRYVLQNGPADRCIDVAIVAEGYRADEMEQFHKDAELACELLFSYEPLTSMKGHFNVVAVAPPSRDSGVSIPLDNVWKETALGSHYSTFYSDRYLTTPLVKRLHDVLAGIPCEHIIILANNDKYGGGGIYNAYTLTSAHHELFRQVLVHEFGHSFGGLGDEYFYEDDLFTETYPVDVEPWEPNITTRVDFASKWQDMLQQGTPIPTPSADSAKYPVGVYQGGGYSAKNLYRPADNCRMRTNEHPGFCPVCRRALQRMIDFYIK